MRLLLALLLLGGTMAAEEYPWPAFKEPLGVGWDKAGHVAMGAAGAEISTLLGKAVLEAFGVQPRKWQGPALSLGGGVLAGALKELADANEPGNKWDWKDLGATVLGSVPSAGIRLTHRF